MVVHALAKALRLLIGPEAAVLRGFADRLLTDTEVDLGILKSTQALHCASTIRSFRRLSGNGIAEQEILLVPLCNIGSVNVGLVVLRGRRAGGGSDWWSARGTNGAWDHFIGRYFREEASGELLYVTSDADGAVSRSEHSIALNWVGPPSGPSGLDRETANIQLDSKAWTKALHLARREGDCGGLDVNDTSIRDSLALVERTVRRQNEISRGLILPTGARDFCGCQANMTSYTGTANVKTIVSKSTHESGGTASTFFSGVKVVYGDDAELTKQQLLRYAWCNRTARQPVIRGISTVKASANSIVGDMKAHHCNALELPQAENFGIGCTDDLELHEHQAGLKEDNGGAGTGIGDWFLQIAVEEQLNGSNGGDLEGYSPPIKSPQKWEVGRTSESSTTAENASSHHGDVLFCANPGLMPWGSLFSFSACDNKDEGASVDAIPLDHHLDLGKCTGLECDRLELQAQTGPCVQFAVSSTQNRLPSATALTAREAGNSAPVRRTRRRKRIYTLEQSEERRKMSNRRSAARANLRRRESYAELERRVEESRFLHAATLARHAALSSENESLRAAV